MMLPAGEDGYMLAAGDNRAAAVSILESLAD